MASVLKDGSGEYAVKMAIVMGAIVVCGAVLAVSGQYFSARAATAVSQKMRSDMYRKINSFEFYDIDKFGTASLINRLTADINAVQNAVLIFVRIAIRAPFLIVGSIIFAMLMDVGIALVIVACLPFLAASFYFITRNLVPRYTAIQKTLDAITLETKEDLDGVRVVRAFNKEEQEIAEFNGYTKKYSDMSIAAGKMSAGLGPLNSFIINCGVTAIVYFVGRAVMLEAFEVANISAFISYMIQIVNALNMITHLTLSFVKAAAGNRRIKEVFDARASFDKIDGGRAAEDGALSDSKSAGILKITQNGNTSEDETTADDSKILEFKDVCFEYSDKSFALTGVSFSLERGRTLGIIGGTGSGKTTLINLIPRFYDAVSGEVLFKGRNVNGYPVAELRRAVVIVAQEAVVISGSVRENIAFGGADMTDARVIEAAKIAQAHEFIVNLRDGYDSVLEQNGRNLSGGQRQRISIARGVARRPDILILDDSSSALDYLTESRLSAALGGLKDVAKIIISQRISSVANADKIIVLDKGRVVGIGRHCGLLKDCKAYANIYESQS
jgi:ATP-binding cassette subfamily B protein